MKKLFYLGVVALMAACTSAPQGYTITGTVDGAADGDSVFLCVREGRKFVNIDSTAIAGGKFTFKGQQDSVRLVTLAAKTNDQRGYSLNLYLENGKIEARLSDFYDKVTGTPTNDRYQPYRDAASASQLEMNELRKEIENEGTDQEKRQELISKYMTVAERTDSLMQVCMKENIGNIIGVEMLKSRYYQMSAEELEELIPQLPAICAQDEAIVRIKEHSAKLSATKVGKKFVDFAMKTPEGKDIKLSDYVGKGKVVLIDFWASWCGPCRREMPNIVEAYKQYKKKGFEIVGVSLDKDLDSWKKAIKALNITWPQMSDLQYWNCEGSRLYGVNSIPHTVLIDGEGTIIARGLHGEELLQKLAEVIK